MIIQMKFAIFEHVFSQSDKNNNWQAEQRIENHICKLRRKKMNNWIQLTMIGSKVWSKQQCCIKLDENKFGAPTIR